MEIYKTQFADGEATETLLFRIGGDSAQLTGYHINSMALITK